MMPGSIFENDGTIDPVNRRFEFRVRDDTGAWASSPSVMSLSITPLNDAPRLFPADPVLPVIDDIQARQTGSGHPGQDIATMLDTSVFDPDTAPLGGIAIIGGSEDRGRWQYSIDGGASWSDVGVVSDSAALLLRDSDRIRFLASGPGASESTLDFRAWDRTSGVVGGRADATLNDGRTAFSWQTDTVTQVVTATAIAPVITSNGGGATASVNVAETTTAVTTVVATDGNGDALTYSISGGADAGRFTIDGATGVLAFAVAPDFEAPADADGDNVYQVIVRASDGSLAATQTVDVSVTDVSRVLIVTTAADTNDSAIVAGNTEHDAEWLNAHQGPDSAISLREAILAANNTTTGGSVTIRFDIPGGSAVDTIIVTSALPTVRHAVDLDGITPDNLPGVMLDGQGGAYNGLTFGAGSAGSTIHGLVVRHFGFAGIELAAGADGTMITRTYIGSVETDGDAAASPLGNDTNGILIAATDVVIGGLTGLDSNVVAGNGQDQIHVLASASRTRIINTSIGADNAGLSAANAGLPTGAGHSGILVSGADRVVIGGATPYHRNLISGNGHYGIELGPGTTNARILNNFIGTDRTGDGALGNAQAGIGLIDVGAGNQIGDAGLGNLIAGNLGDGIYIRDSIEGALLQGNRIGIRYSSGTALFNGADAVRIEDSTGIVVGTDGDGVDDNDEANALVAIDQGVSIGGAGASGNVVAGNHIGTNAGGGAALGIDRGVTLFNGAHDNRIGGTTSLEANRIVGATGPAIQVGVDAGIGNALLGNLVASPTGGLAIDVGLPGTNVNDPGDGDTGPNDLQNHPVVTRASSGAAGSIHGSLDSTPNHAFRIELFSSPVTATGGSGLPASFIGFVDVTTDAGGHADFSFATTGLTAGHFVSATATRADAGFTTYGSTSEFSVARVTLAATPPTGSDRTETVLEDASLTLGRAMFGVADANGDTFSGLRLDRLPVSGLLTLNGTAVAAGQTVAIADIDAGRLVYTPAPDANDSIVPVVTDRQIDFSVRDSSGVYSTAPNTLTLSITPVDDAPVISSNGGGATATVNVAENTTAVTTVTVSDPDGPLPVFSIAGGADAALFAIDATTGALRFVTAPDYESPLDSGANNQYEVTVQATAAGQVATQALTVSVTDVSNVLVVTTTADTNDAGIPAGLPTRNVEWLNANRGADTAISLREAILAANNTAGSAPVAIHFAIPGTATHTIVLGSALPAITRPVILDASTDDSFAANGSRPAVVIDGAGIAGTGLTLASGAGGSTIRGLVLTNLATGIAIAAGADGNIIAGNYIGAIGTDGLASATRVSGWGITVASAGNRIGGSLPADANLVTSTSTVMSGGVLVTGENADDNDIVGNRFGIHADGTVAANSGYRPIQVTGGADRTRIGGPGAQDGNWIARARAGGIEVGANSDGTVIEGNRIGTDLAGSANWGSSGSGIYLDTGAGHGTTTVRNNVVANSGGYGIQVVSGAGNVITRNSLYGNSTLGIGLGSDGVSPNDAGDADTGANNLQNFPVLTDAVTDGTGRALITGTLNSAPSGWYRIEFFSSPSAHATGHGEGRTYLGHVDVATDAAGNASFAADLAATVPAGRIITSTATRAVDATFSSLVETSEFSANATVRAALLVVTTELDTNDSGVTTGATYNTAWLNANRGADTHISLREALIAANNTTGWPVMIRFAIAGTGVHVIHVGAALPTITRPVVIDGRSDDSFAANGSRPAIVLDGGDGNYNGLAFGGSGAGSGGSTVIGLSIRNFGQAGILIGPNSNGTRIVGNYLGSLAPDGSALATTFGNVREGILIQSTDVVIGGTTAADHHVIAGNARDQIQLTATASRTRIIGNYIGTDATGTVDVTAYTTPSVNHSGILVSGADSVVIGGTTAAERNLVSGNNYFGIELSNSTRNARIQGNYVGTDVTGMLALGNGEGGIGLYEVGTGNLVGGSAAGAGNLVSGNQGVGVYVGRSTQGALVQGNRIGVAADDSRALHNAWEAVSISASSGVIVGTNGDGAADAAEGNQMLANDRAVVILGAASTGNVVAGNLFGGNLAGNLSLGLARAVHVYQGAHHNRIGGTSAVEANRIVGASGAALRIFSDAGVGNAVLGNLLVNPSGALAIDVGASGVTANDPGDGDSGANDLQNHPVIHYATADAVTGRILGTLDSEPNRHYRFELYGSPVATTAGTGVPGYFLGFVNVTTDGSGRASFTLPTGSVTPGHYVSATATQADSGFTTFASTSEFSAAFIARAPTAPTGADRTVTVAEDASVVLGRGDFGYADINGDAFAAVRVDALPVSGSLRLGGVAVTLTQVIAIADIDAGLLRYVPAADASNDDTAAADRRWRFSVQDATGAWSTSASTQTFSITPINDAPAVTTSAGSVGYAENDPPVVVDGGIQVSDVDSASLASATVRITGNYVEGQDALAFANLGGITGAWNAATGTLTLTGTATVADYQAALRTVTYANASEAPSTADRTIRFIVDDGSLASAATTRLVTIQAVNDAPAVWTSPGPVTYIENDPPLVIDGGLQVSDVDSPTLAGATVRITGNYVNGQDVLASAGLGSITAAWDATSGTLTLSGPGTVADYQAALRAVTYANTSDAPSTAVRTVSVQLDDGSLASTAATRDIILGAVNDAPVVTASSGSVNFVETGAPVVIDGGLAVADVDSAMLAGATVRITGNYVSGQDVLVFTNLGSIAGAWDEATGTLSLTGAASVADYQAALRTITYANTSMAPSTASRTIDFTVSDGSLASASATRLVTIQAVNNAPEVTSSAGSIAYRENDAPVVIDGGLQVTDVDSAMLAGATVRIIGNYVDGEDVLAFAGLGGITAAWDTATGTLTLTGAGTVADYQAALRTVTYANTSDDPSTADRTVRFLVNDGNLTSTDASRTVTVEAVNDAPVVTTLPGVTNTVENVAAVAVDPDLTVTDADSATLTGATVRITGNHAPAEDLLSFTALAGITGTWDAATGTLSFSGNATVADYQALLRSVSYRNTSDDPSAATRTVSFTVDDGTATSASATRVVTVTAVNDAPVVTIDPTPIGYTENAPAVAIDPLLTVTDVDSPMLTGATVTLTANHAPSEDVLSFTARAGITGTWDAATGTLRFSGNASVADYQALLRSVSYQNTSDDPSTATRIVSISVDDDSGLASPVATRGLTVTAVNDRPTTVDAIGSGVEDGVAIVVDLAGDDVDGNVVGFRLTDLPVGGRLYHDAALTLPVAAADLVVASAGQARLWFVPAADWHGTAVFGHVAIDDDGLESLPATTTIVVAPVNDAPRLVPGTTVLLPITSHMTGGTGVSAAELVAGRVTDVDGDGDAGVVITSATTDAGRWQFSLDGGRSWQDIGAVSAQHGLMLGGEDRIRLQPVPGVPAQARLDLQAWDRTGGRAGDHADASQAGGTGPFSVETLTVLQAVDWANQAPVIVSHDGRLLVPLTRPPGVAEVTTVVATDADEPAQVLVYSIAGGPDAAQYAIDPQSGVLRWLRAPAGDQWTDADRDGRYEVVVAVSDGFDRVEQWFSIELLLQVLPTAPEIDPPAPAPLEPATPIAPLPRPPGPATDDAISLIPTGDGGRGPGASTTDPDVVPTEDPWRLARISGAAMTGSGFAAGSTAGAAAPTRLWLRDGASHAADEALWWQWLLPVDLREIGPVDPARDAGSGILARLQADTSTIEAATVTDGGSLGDIDLRFAGGMAVGFSLALWLARGGALLASLMTTTPVWRSFDLLPVIRRGRDPDEDEAEANGDGTAGAAPARDPFEITDLSDESEPTVPLSSDHRPTERMADAGPSETTPS